MSPIWNRPLPGSSRIATWPAMSRKSTGKNGARNSERFAYSVDITTLGPLAISTRDPGT
jgi:hypothetical protein